MPTKDREVRQSRKGRPSRMIKRYQKIEIGEEKEPMMNVRFVPLVDHHYHFLFLHHTLSLSTLR